ncbi:hypothetical protein HPP92_012603 [Vanilla planifolia]|uniref:Uncharacterized protein n=1 Tax=Vanilla planifolia TaxID=51239 RepID=A0A835QX65_VANPL|nr:hypothetical protein HPP92_012603 [Vanilla planifolia]
MKGTNLMNLRLLRMPAIGLPRTSRRNGLSTVDLPETKKTTRIKEMDYRYDRRFKARRV